MLEVPIRVLSLVLLGGALITPVRRWRRTAFVGFIVLGLGSFALRAGWPESPLSPRACEGLVGPRLALHSFQNTPHILLFALCFFLARAQFERSTTDRRSNRRTGAGAFAITLAVGALVELAEGATGAGHCRLRDLLPDAAGALLAWAALAVFLRSFRFGRIIRHPST